MIMSGDGPQRSGGAKRVGWNRWGSLGLGDNIDRKVPTQIPNVKAKQVSVGTLTVIIDLDDNVWVDGPQRSGGRSEAGVIIIMDS